MDNERLRSLIVNGNIMLLDFGATWCGPCQRLKPIIKDIKDEFKDSVEIIEIDVDENAELAADYGIRAVPTLIFLKKGKEVTRLFGLQSKESITKNLNVVLTVN